MLSTDPRIIEIILHDGLMKYKYKNSKNKPLQATPETIKGAIFGYHDKNSMIAGRGFVLTSEEAVQENDRKLPHWTPNIFRYGTYADWARQFTKGHPENDLRQISTFVIDFDIRSTDQAITMGDFLTTALDLGFMPTMIIKSDKGYQTY